MCRLMKIKRGEDNSVCRLFRLYQSMKHLFISLLCRFREYTVKPTMLDVHKAGLVVALFEFYGQTHCLFDMTDFPYDTQNCSLYLAPSYTSEVSWYHFSFDIRHEWLTTLQE